MLIYPIVLDAHETALTMRDVSLSTIVTIDVDGEEYAALVRERQRFILKDGYMHIDFLAVSLTEKVTTLVNVFLVGEAPAVNDLGLLLTTNIDRVEVSALPQDLPEGINVDVSILKDIGDSITVGDLVMPDGVECLSDTEETVVVITAPTLAAEEEEDEIEGEEDLDADVEPEVIEKGKGEEDEE